MSDMTFLCLYRSYLDAFALLEDAMLGRLIRAMLEYMEAGAEPTLTGPEKYLWPMMKSQIDRDTATYLKKCETNRRNAAKGGRPRSEKTRQPEPTETHGNPSQANAPKEKENEKESEKKNKKGKEKENKNKNNIFLSIPPLPSLSGEEGAQDVKDVDYWRKQIAIRQSADSS